ncbi:hypothetical protein ACJX0J_020007, partial [Zea mays]
CEGWANDRVGAVDLHSSIDAEEVGLTRVIARGYKETTRIRFLKLSSGFILKKVLQIKAPFVFPIPHSFEFELQMSSDFQHVIHIMFTFHQLILTDAKRIADLEY